MVNQQGRRSSALNKKQRSFPIFVAQVRVRPGHEKRQNKSIVSLRDGKLQGRRAVKPLSVELCALCDQQIYQLQAAESIG